MSERRGLERLQELRWPNGPVCPHCGGNAARKVAAQTRNLASRTRLGLYRCRHCHREYSGTIGTIFEQTHIPVDIWFSAIELMCATRAGITARQLNLAL